MFESLPKPALITHTHSVPESKPLQRTNCSAKLLSMSASVPDHRKRKYIVICGMLCDAETELFVYEKAMTNLSGEWLLSVKIDEVHPTKLVSMIKAC